MKPNFWRKKTFKWQNNNIAIINAYITYRGSNKMTFTNEIIFQKNKMFFFLNMIIWDNVIIKCLLQHLAHTCITTYSGLNIKIMSKNDNELLPYMPHTHSICSIATQKEPIMNSVNKQQFTEKKSHMLG